MWVFFFVLCEVSVVDGGIGVCGDAGEGCLFGFLLGVFGGCVVLLGVVWAGWFGLCLWVLCGLWWACWGSRLLGCGCLLLLWGGAVVGTVLLSAGKDFLGHDVFCVGGVLRHVYPFVSFLLFLVKHSLRL